MKKVYARVAVEFEVDEKLFEEDPDKALQEALKNGKAVLSDGDNYLPEPWNEGVIKEDVGFSLGVHALRVN